MLSAIRTLLIFFVLFAPRESNAEPYKIETLSDVSIELTITSTIFLDDSDLSFAIAYENKKRKHHKLKKLYTEGYIIDNINVSYRLIRSFNELHGLPTKTCKPLRWVKIVIVSSRTMFYSDLFRQVRDKHNKFVKLYGAYYEDSNDIVVTPLNKRDQLLVFHHEMAHYWWDVMCIDETYYSDSEQYAQDFEKYVTKLNKWYRKELHIRL